jgi:glycosyltransferase involved in cell wall biosynthesis
MLIEGIAEMRDVYINGRFLTQSITGVQRVATEILLQLDRDLEDGKISDIRLTILAPKDIVHSPNFKQIKIKKVGALKGQAWEQIELPFYSKGKLLVNFCNTAPVYKRKQIAYIHDTAILDAPEGFSKQFIQFYKFIFGRVTSRALHIMTVSNFSKKRIVEHYPKTKNKVSVTYLGTEHLLETDKEKNQILVNNNLRKGEYLLAVSSANPNKNFKVIADMLDRNEQLNKDVVIVGSITSKVFKNEQLENSNIKRIGYVSDEELTTLYKNAGIFIFPSIYEGFGLPPLEAMIHRTPVIAAHSASIPEILLDNAVYFDAKDSDELFSKVNKLLSDEELRHNLEIKGRNHAESFSWKKTANELYMKIKEHSG